MKVSLLIGLGFFAVSAFGTQAASPSGPAKKSFYDFPLHQVDAKAVDCDELKGIARFHELIQAAGHVVAGSSENCLYMRDRRYDFFEAKGGLIWTRSGRCVVWTCDPVRDHNSFD